ncbi:MAG: SRPBCC family protein [Chloroflexota bacterium]
MARAEVSTTINRSVEEVFAVVGDAESAPKWSSASLESTKTSAGPTGVASPAHRQPAASGAQLAGVVRSGSTM